MSIKTTINLKIEQVQKIRIASEKCNVSMSSIINSIVKITLKSNNYKYCFFKCIKYQNRAINPNLNWKRFPVSFKEDIYEKCFDMKKLYKLSASYIIADAIENYLDKFILDMYNSIKSDNYSSNYIVLYTKFDFYNQITLLWNNIETEKLLKLMQIHNIQ